jgi:enoyl-CoA hydratase/carnithine racemase
MNANSQPVTITRQDDIALVRYDRGSKANAMSFAIMDDLAEAALGLLDDTALRGVVLTGTPTIFSAGMDLSDPLFDQLDTMPLAQMRHISERGPRMARAWTSIEVPVICAIEGPCLAGGLALSSMCDFRVASSTALFGAPEVQVAHNMGWHSVPRLISLVGAQATRRILLAGEQWNVDEAKRVGFVDHTCEAGEALNVAMDLARRIASYPDVAVRMIKRQIDASAHALDYATSAYDKDQQLVVWMSDDFKAARRKFSK